jgi:predicted NBD/HSP70 family sugar kinase/predicted transcriptional regulator
VRRIDLKNAKTASNSTIRDINRQIVLNYVRDKEPISRADIARETALQRSTVSIITETLKADGLIEEIGEGESTGGRRPTLLRLRAAGVAAIGVDISPLQTTVAMTDLAGRILEREDFPTSPRRERTLEQIAASVKSIKSRATKNMKGVIEGVGISLPGLVNPSTGHALYIPYFKWREWPIAAELSAITGLPVTIDNDANAAALAELWFGRPEVSEPRDFIMVLVAEGIGTGIVFDRQVYRGERSAAGEFGHMIVGQEGPVACSCGNYDCWEAFSSNYAAVARYNKLTARRDGKRTMSMKKLVKRALEGEPAAMNALMETARYLGIGISNMIVGLSPEAVVVSGLITQAWPLITGALEETVARSIRRGLPSARIVPSTLGDQPTLMGAVSLVLARKFAAFRAA